MDGDIRLTSEQAVTLQERYQQTFLVMWVVTWNPSDYPRKAVARPHMIQGGGTDHVLRTVLVADSLDELRQALPPGLSQIQRMLEDDAVITEVWL